MKNIHLLPTDKPSILGRFIDTNNLFLRVSNDIPRGENVNIYITSDEEIKEGVDVIFKENSELSKIGTKQEYSAYLDTIFPDSKVKDIVYHATNAKFEKFDKSFAGTGVGDNLSGKFMFSLDKEDYAKYFKYLISALVNIETNSFTDKGSNSGFVDVDEVGVFEPEQIHILSSKADIEGFRNYVAFENSEFAKYGTYQQFQEFIINKSSMEIENRLIETGKIDRVC